MRPAAAPASNPRWCGLFPTLSSVPLDCLILGGGVAGLWTLRGLLAAGYDAALVESRALGHGQTIASQGILHAGTKYALTGHAAQASRAVAEAAAVWRDCLKGGGNAGRGPAAPDLSAVSVLSRHTHLFTTPGVGSRLAGLAASKALAIGPRRLERPEFPLAFAAAPAGVTVYELDEPVLDGPSLLRTLADPAGERLVGAESVSLEREGQRVTVRLGVGGEQREFTTRSLVLAAGAGNEPLLALLGLDAEIKMQRRPLHMALARAGAGSGLPALFAHCVSLSEKPRATITSATDGAGRPVWYIGGQVAETGVDLPRDEQILAARRELESIVPWIDLRGLEWASLRIDRAEGFDLDGRRPDAPVVRATGPVIACWPTKLVLAPLAAAQVLDLVGSLGIEPSGGASGAADLPRPPVAISPWDREDLPWS